MNLEKDLHWENSDYNTKLSKWYQTKINNHKSLMLWRGLERKKFKLFPAGIMEDRVENKDVLEKLKQLGINISERGLQDQIKKGLGPKPTYHSTGKGLNNEHGPAAYAELYASNKCLRGRLKVRLAAMYRTLAILFYRNPEFFFDNIATEYPESDIRNVFKWIALKEKALADIKDNQGFDVIFTLNKDGGIEKKEIVYKNFDTETILVFAAAGIKNVVSIDVILEDGTRVFESVLLANNRK